MTKQFIRTFVNLTAALIVGICGWTLYASWDLFSGVESTLPRLSFPSLSSPPPLPPPLPPISKIEAMSELAASRVQISDKLWGQNRHYRVLWLIHGIAVLGVDLSSASYGDVDKDKMTAVLKLPPPHVISCKVDHHRSEELKVIRQAWIAYVLSESSLESLRDEVWSRADEKLLRLASSGDYEGHAKIQTERILTRLFRDTGWKLKVVWQKSTPNETGESVTKS